MTTLQIVENLTAWEWLFMVVGGVALSRLLLVLIDQVWFCVRAVAKLRRVRADRRSVA